MWQSVLNGIAKWIQICGVQMYKIVAQSVLLVKSVLKVYASATGSAKCSK